MDRRLGAIVSGATLAVACAIGAGRGFATLEGAEVGVALEPEADRDLGASTLLTNAGYHVQLHTATLEVHAIGLEAETEAVTETDGEDHGHDHGLTEGTAGAALTGDEEGAFVPVAILEIERALDLLDERHVPVDSIVPSAELPEAHLRSLHIELGHLHLEGTVTHPDPAVLGGEALALSVDLPTGDLAATMDVEVGRDGPPSLYLVVELHLEAPPFDGADFAAHATDGQVVIGSPDHPLAAPIVDAILAGHLEHTLAPPEEPSP